MKYSYVVIALVVWMLMITSGNAALISIAIFVAIFAVSIVVTTAERRHLHRTCKRAVERPKQRANREFGAWLDRQDAITAEYRRLLAEKAHTRATLASSKQLSQQESGQVRDEHSPEAHRHDIERAWRHRTTRKDCACPSCRRWEQGPKIRDR